MKAQKIFWRTCCYIFISYHFLLHLVTFCAVDEMNFSSLFFWYARSLAALLLPPAGFRGEKLYRWIQTRKTRRCVAKYFLCGKSHGKPQLWPLTTLEGKLNKINTEACDFRCAVRLRQHIFSYIKYCRLNHSQSKFCNREVVVTKNLAAISGANTWTENKSARQANETECIYMLVVMLFFYSLLQWLDWWRPWRRHSPIWRTCETSYGTILTN